MFSRMYRAEGRELLPTRSGPGSFLWFPRHPLPCRPRPISVGPRAGREEAKPRRGTYRCPHLPLFCLQIPPLGKAGLTQGHRPRTLLFSCHPAVGNRRSFLGTTAQAREENAAVRKMLPVPGDIYQGNWFGACCPQPVDLHGLPSPLLDSVWLQICEDMPCSL